MIQKGSIQIAVVVGLLFTVLGLKANPKMIVMKGSDTVLPIGQLLAEEYFKKHPKDSLISVTGGGSGVGITALLDGTCDIAMSSRELSSKELETAKAKGRPLMPHVIGYDGIAVIVHPENPLAQLTIPQIGTIFSGEVTNWKQLGGPDLSIVVVSRESTSGTYVYFKEAVLQQKDFHKKTLLLPATANIVNTVKNNKAAIGYVGLAYVKPGVKALKVSAGNPKRYIAPSIASVKNKSYPIARPLFLIMAGKMSEPATAFLNYIMSAEGQKILLDKSYVPVN
ncbi:MAG: phosphate ABC transporter substrate-binding protein [Deltaproteobacteria bacterium]|nr:phosphate ABC transporter substrate-binding protein [Deltaproteobacteria bacterium]